MYPRANHTHLYTVCKHLGVLSLTNQVLVYVNALNVCSEPQVEPHRLATRLRVSWGLAGAPEEHLACRWPCSPLITALVSALPWDATTLMTTRHSLELCITRQQLGLPTARQYPRGGKRNNDGVCVLGGGSMMHSFTPRRDNFVAVLQTPPKLSICWIRFLLWLRRTHRT